MAWHPQYQPRTPAYRAIMHTQVELAPGVFHPLGYVVEQELRAWQASYRKRWEKRVGWNNQDDPEVFRIRRLAGAKAAGLAKPKPRKRKRAVVSGSEAADPTGGAVSFEL